MSVQRKVLLLSMPFRRYTDSMLMIPELLDLGQALHNELDALPIRTVVIISGDLAHTHDKDGPYGYSSAAGPFDAAIIQWEGQGNRDALLTAAAGYVQEALSCGFPGFVMLQGMLDARGGPEVWTPQLLAAHHPSYYGMSVAAFLPRQRGAMLTRSQHQTEYVVGCVQHV